MDKDACRKILDELAQEVLAEDSPLCWMIARELADFTVAFIVANDGQLSPAGTGTLVSYRDSHYFLTAAHVWEKKLRVSDWIRIPLKENSPCRFAISPNEIISCGAPIPARWNEWGPDITLLRFPPERVGSFTAVGRNNLSDGCARASGKIHHGKCHPGASGNERFAGHWAVFINRTV